MNWARENNEVFTRCQGKISNLYFIICGNPVSLVKMNRGEISKANMTTTTHFSIIPLYSHTKVRTNNFTELTYTFNCQ